MATTTAALPLEQISLRQRERAFLLGGTQAGKSTLADYLGAEFMARYAHVGARRLMLDTKPRYRAQWQSNGLSAKRRYRKWDHGPVVADSVVCDDPHELERCFAIAPTVIVQCESRLELPRVVSSVATFLRSSRRGRPQLLDVDEVLDFYHPNGAPRGGDDAVTRAVRAGAERGTSVLVCSQRTRGIPTEVIEMLNRCYLFRLDARADARRLQEMGAPPSLIPPRREHQFMYWTKADYERVYGPYRLQLGDGVAAPST